MIDDFKSSVTLVNFPCFEKFPLRKDIQKIYVTWSDNHCWHYKKIGTIAPGEAKEIHSDDLAETVPKSPFIFFHYLDLPEKSEQIILSDHMHFMPTWRGNIKIYSDTTATSYEGDYQYEMVKYIKTGSLVSLSPMLQNSDHVKTKFIFVNITITPKINEHPIHFFDPIREKILYSTTVFNNQCNIISLDSVCMPMDTPLLILSHSIAGIPIYFSHSTDGKHLSFEHTHPPASLVVFGEPLYFQHKFKDFWLKKIKEKSIC